MAEPVIPLIVSMSIDENDNTYGLSVNSSNEEYVLKSASEFIPIVDNDYNALENKPKVNGRTLEGDLTSEDIGIIVPEYVSELINDGDGTSAFATESYVQQNGGKIDSISVNGIEQTITNKNVDINVPAKTSELLNDTGFITNSSLTGFVYDPNYVHTDNNYANSDKTKLSSVQSGAEVNAINTVTVNNLVNYYLKSETYTQAEVNSLIGAITTLNIQVVEQLPTTDISSNTIYFVPNEDPEYPNIYDEYIYVSNSWELIGTTKVDLSDYYTKTQVDTLLNNKIDKVSGKGLSTEDFTTAEKTKLAGIETGAEVNVNADWNASSGDAEILNKPTTISGYGITDAYAKTETDTLLEEKQDALTAGDNITITQSSDVPSGYTELSSITSHVAEWIDTGVKLTNNFKSIIVGRVPSTPTNNFRTVLGAVNNNLTLGKQNVLLGWATGGWYVEPCTNPSYVYSTYPLDTNTHTFTTTVTSSTTSINIDGIINSVTSTPSITNVNLSLFGRLGADGNAVSLINFELNSVRLYQSNVLVFNGIPAKRNSDGEIGLYETVTNTFLTNSGTEAFTAGDEVQAGTVISATDTTYTAGTGLTLSGTEFSADTTVLATKEDLTNYYTSTETDELLANKQDVLTAGTGINITNNVISAVSTDAEVVQVAGDNQDKVMSQKAVTYNTSTEYGKCLQVMSTSAINLTDEQVTRLNNCDVISVRMVERGVHPNQYENRYVRLYGGDQNNNGIALTWYFANTLFYRNYQYGQASYALNRLNNVTIIPDVQTAVIDRVNGIVKFYAGTTLCTTYTADEFKSDYFIPLNKKCITLSGGDVQAKFYDIQIYDTDISPFFDDGSFVVYNANASGAQTLYGPFKGGYQFPTVYTDATPSSYTGQTTGSWVYSRVDDIRTISYTGATITSNRAATGYYIGGADNTNAYLYKSYLTVTGGNIKIYSGHSISASVACNILGIYDVTTDELVADVNNIGEGSYYILGSKIGVSAWWMEAVSGNPVVQHTKDAWKRVQCLFHLKGDTLYNGKAYDDEVDTFYTIPSTIVLSTEELRNPIVRNKLFEGQFAHYDGEILIDKFNNANKIYCAMNYSFKQINNS